MSSPEPESDQDPALTTDFDIVVLGTGLTECIMSGLMSVDGKKVLHMDKNDFYGDAAASLTLDQLLKKFEGPDAVADDSMGSKRDYNCDLIPKFVMAKGLLVKILLHTKTTHYLDFAKVDGSYVMAKGYVNKVPSTAKEALSSNLMGMFEKRRMKKILDFVGQYDPADAATHQGKDCTTMTTAELFAGASLDESTVTFMGHAIALWTDDDYLAQPAVATCIKMRQYAESMMMYGGSPYIYPLYGLGDLPQAFARLSAVYGGTFMLDTPFNGITTDDDGELNGVKSKVNGSDCELKCKAIFASPQYFPDRVEQIGEIVRCYCIINQPVKPDGKNVIESGQVIIPGREAGKKNDIYVMWMGKTLQVAPAGHYIALISTVKESADGAGDIAAGLKLLPSGAILKQYLSVDPVFKPKETGGAEAEENIFISKSYDATSHFEGCCLDCLDLYKRYTGTDLVLVDNTKEAEA